MDRKKNVQKYLGIARVFRKRAVLLKQKIIEMQPVPAGFTMVSVMMVPAQIAVSGHWRCAMTPAMSPGTMTPSGVMDREAVCGVHSSAIFPDFRTVLHTVHIFHSERDQVAEQASQRWKVSLCPWKTSIPVFYRYIDWLITVPLQMIDFT